MVMVHGKEYPVTGSALTRSIEFHCRQGVEDLVRQIRMEALPSPLSENQSSAGASLNRPVCKQAVSSTASLYQLETRSTGNSHGCFHSGLVQHSSKALCQPPMESSRQSPISDTQPGGTGISFSGASMESPILVSTVASDAGQRTTSHSSIAGNNPINNLPDISPQLAMWVVSGIDDRVATFQNQLQASFCHHRGSNLPNHTTPPSTSGLAGVTNRIEIPISDIANFLAELFQEGYQYSSINVYRSSISTTHDRVDGYSIGQYPTIIRLMKGIFNKRPPVPKYAHTWDVSKVTSYISSLDDNADLSLKVLSFKLVMLLALPRPSRSSDLIQFGPKLSKAPTRWYTIQPLGVGKAVQTLQIIGIICVSSFSL